MCAFSRHQSWQQTSVCFVFGQNDDGGREKGVRVQVSVSVTISAIFATEKRPKNDQKTAKSVFFPFINLKPITWDFCGYQNDFCATSIKVGTFFQSLGILGIFSILLVDFSTTTKLPKIFNVPKTKTDVLTLIMVAQKSFLCPQKPQSIVF